MSKGILVIRMAISSDIVELWPIFGVIFSSTQRSAPYEVTLTHLVNYGPWNSVS
jgi:hypothetical protein